MKLWRVVFLGVIVVTLLSACKQPTNEEVYYKAQKKLNEMESYKCTVRISVSGNEGVREYVLEQMFKYPDRYRLEVIEPAENKGNATIYNGKTAWVISPSLNQIWKMNSFERSNEQLLFIGYFMKNMLNNESTTITSEALEEDFIVIKTDLPTGNFYFHSQKLWISSKELVPTQLQILDEKENIRFRVHFEDFQYNPKLEDELFFLNTEEE
ncbi:LolA family protein [Alkaliphilus peptidifermentans]|uniref:Outer membrane lipoprotein-sorting protein n=1 Tax=Alkaliphilus peptidifermentans DSM 18978 TaxID=1120976 RepID=A0A1G5GDE8_9FIRM|nr:outer-membrane lipoprotein carrier protein LolA [Alkaliphilus peptidifermentans]SCY49377.1 Outer membrane lipoprotein-sorting protein [Alkaliphilus peptidifermentans DSM 18978]